MLTSTWNTHPAPATLSRISMATVDLRLGPDPVQPLAKRLRERYPELTARGRGLCDSRGWTELA